MESNDTTIIAWIGRDGDSATIQLWWNKDEKPNVNEQTVADILRALFEKLEEIPDLDPVSLQQAIMKAAMSGE